MTTALTPVTEISNTLVKMQDSFKEALPSHIPAERFVAVAKTAIINNPFLATLDRQSVYQALFQCASDGLMPDGREAAIVPYAGKGKYTPMTAGICKKVRNSGEIGAMDAQSVYANDQYDAWTDEKGAHFKFVKARGDRGAYTLTFAYALGKDGSVFFEEIDAETMTAIKKQALSKLKPEQQKNSPWSGSFEDEMRRKSALRRLCKYRLPNSSDLNSVFERDDETLDATDDAETPTGTSRPSRLGAIIEAQAEPAANQVFPTIEEATTMAQEAIPEAKVVTPPPATQGLIVTGKIENLTAKDGEKSGKPWRRFAVKVGGNFYGTFDTKINDIATAAVDAGQDVQIEYKERQQGGKVFRDIVSLTVAGDDEGIPI